MVRGKKITMGRGDLRADGVNEGIEGKRHEDMGDKIAPKTTVCSRWCRIGCRTKTKYDPTTSTLRNDLHWLPIESRIRFKWFQANLKTNLPQDQISDLRCAPYL